MEGMDSGVQKQQNLEGIIKIEQEGFYFSI